LKSVWATSPLGSAGLRRSERGQQGVNEKKNKKRGKKRKREKEEKKRGKKAQTDQKGQVQHRFEKQKQIHSKNKPTNLNEILSFFLFFLSFFFFSLFPNCSKRSQACIHETIAAGVGEVRGSFFCCTFFFFFFFLFFFPFFVPPCCFTDLLARHKVSTGLVGLPVRENARADCIKVFQQLQKAAQTLPEGREKVRA
jgi:hypothetical protein